MARHDIVYLLKNNIEGEELRYSIRSVVQNFPYKRIVFVGGKPEGIEPDIYIPDEQIGSTKAQRSTHSLKLALRQNNLTEDIWLFNDDFFIMDRVREEVNYFNGTLDKRILDVRRTKGFSSYCRGLEIMRSKLFNMNKDTLSFAVHVPMLINRAKALALFDKYPDLSMFRSFYGNYYEIDCRYMKDVKVLDNETIPDTPFISTSDESFSKGKVGEFLRKYFSEPTKYETGLISINELYDEEGNERYS